MKKFSILMMLLIVACLTITSCKKEDLGPASGSVELITILDNGTPVPKPMGIKYKILRVEVNSEWYITVPTVGPKFVKGQTLMYQF